MSKKNQEIVEIGHAEEISFEIMELDDLALDEVIGGALAINKCTNATNCNSNTDCQVK